MPGSNRIGGGTSAEGSRWFRSFDPRTGQPTGRRFPDATPGEITQAIDLALEAAPVIAGFSSAQRADLLVGFSEQLQRHGPRLTAQADIETGLGHDHLAAELEQCCRHLRTMAEAVADGQDVGAVISSTGRTARTQGSSRTLWVGRGPVVVFGTAASPFLSGVPGADAVSALAAGCPVISKANPAHPATAEACAGVIDGALRLHGWPPGAHALLHGQRGEVEEDIVSASGIAAVAYNGPGARGRELFDLANGRPDPVPFFAATANANPVVVLPGAITRRADDIARGIADAVTFAGGQGSTRPGLVVVPADVGGDWFLDAIATRLRRAGRQPMLTAEIHTTFATAVAERAAHPGVTPLIDRVIDASPGYAQEPVLLLVDTDAFFADPQLHGEVFGPLLIAVRTTVDRMADVVESLPVSAVATLHTDTDSNESRGCARIVAALSSRADRLVVNRPLGVADCEPAGLWPLASAGEWLPPGQQSLRRWQRAVTYEDVPDALLPPALQDANPLNVTRVVDGVASREPL